MEKYSDDPIVALSGNKLYLEENRQVSYEEGAKLAQKYGFLFYETSAKQDTYVSDIFENEMKKYTQIHYQDEKQQKVIDSEDKQSTKYRECCFIF